MERRAVTVGLPTIRDPGVPGVAAGRAIWLNVVCPVKYSKSLWRRYFAAVSSCHVPGPARPWPRRETGWGHGRRSGP
jgi:hypothetical protein